MKILVLNAGSSSLKFQLFELPDKNVLVSGLIERIGETDSKIEFQIHRSEEENEEFSSNEDIPDHYVALTRLAMLLLDQKCGAIQDQKEIKMVGHRVVHGGEKFSKTTLVTDEVLQELHRLSYLAPLHNPANISGVEVSMKVFKEAKQVAVFDTAFHQTMPDYAYRYAIPNQLYDNHGIRAYGFHGTSHQFVSRQGALSLNIELRKFNAITIHLGNGCSMAAVQNGKCIDTSMGLTPLSGLIMGTRSGDLDPSLVLFLANSMGINLKEIDNILNKQSGLKGLTGDNDLRGIIARYERGDPQALLAIEMYVYRIKKYIGAYAAALGRLDAIIFTAGVGENSDLIRKKVCENLQILGLALDNDKNMERRKGIRQVQSPDSKVAILVVPTNEELEIANQVVELMNKTED